MIKKDKVLSEYVEGLKSHVLDLDGVLSEDERAEALSSLKAIEDEIDRLEKARVQLGRLMDYDKLKKRGFSHDEVRAFEREDSDYISRVDRYYANNLQKRKYMFGYPANMED